MSHAASVRLQSAACICQAKACCLCIVAQLRCQTWIAWELIHT